MAVPGVTPFLAPQNLTPIQQVLAVTPANSTPLPGGVTRGFFVGAAGNMVATDSAGNQFTMALGANQVGSIIWICITQVQATGTTCTGIYACY